MEQDVIENHPVKEKEKSAKDTLTWIVNSVFVRCVYFSIKALVYFSHRMILLYDVLFTNEYMFNNKIL